MSAIIVGKPKTKKESNNCSRILFSSEIIDLIKYDPSEGKIRFRSKQLILLHPTSIDPYDVFIVQRGFVPDITNCFLDNTKKAGDISGLVADCAEKLYEERKDLMKGKFPHYKFSFRPGEGKKPSYVDWSWDKKMENQPDGGCAYVYDLPLTPEKPIVYENDISVINLSIPSIREAPLKKKVSDSDFFFLCTEYFVEHSSKKSIEKTEICGIEERADLLWKDLIAKGYIDDAGNIQEKFKCLPGFSDMSMDPMFLDKQEDVYNLLNGFYRVPKDCVKGSGFVKIPGYSPRSISDHIHKKIIDPSAKEESKKLYSLISGWLNDSSASGNAAENRSDHFIVINVPNVTINNSSAAHHIPDPVRNLHVLTAGMSSNYTFEMMLYHDDKECAIAHFDKNQMDVLSKIARFDEKQMDTLSKLTDYDPKQLSVMDKLMVSCTLEDINYLIPLIKGRKL